MNSRWSDSLRKRMEAHEEPSPDGLWEDIEQIITKEFPLLTEERPVQLQSGQEKFLVWARRIGAAAALLLLLFLIGNLFMKEESPQSPLISQKSEPTHKPESPLSKDHDHEEILFAEESLSESITSNNKKKDLMLPGSAASTATRSPSTASASTETASIESGTTEPVSTASADIKTDAPSIDKESETGSGKQSELPEEGSGMEGKNTGGDPVSREEPHDYKAPVPNNTGYPATARRSKPARWETNLYASNTSSGSTKEYIGYRSFLAEEISGAKNDVTPLLVKHPHEGIVAANKQSSVYSEAQHRQPVTMGASLKYNINEKWSLTGGLTYTILSSQLRSGSHSHHYSSKQTLHNIGIPLSVNYNLLKRGNISLYISGGGAVEKNVYGKLTTDYVLNDKLESTEKENISIDRLQWSLNTALGIEYTLFHKIGLYAEPGLIYYFKNGSEIETIYKEKPINLNIRVGLRFSLGN